MTEIELLSDQERQQDRAELAQYAQHESNRRLEHLMKQIREKAAEQGWPENRAGSNLPAYLRLAQVAKDYAKNPSPPPR